MTDASEKKRILYVITKANWGGAQRYVYDLAVAATALGHDVAVAYGEPGMLADRLEVAGVRHMQIPGLTRDINVFKEFSSLENLMRLLRSSKPDVVHVNSSKGGLALLAARLTKVPRIIFTSHGWAFNEDRSFEQRLIFRFAYAVMVMLSHTTICVSDAIRRDASRFPLSAHKLLVVRNGIDAISFKDRTVARKTLADDIRARTWIGVVAELHPTKRLEDLIEAYGQIRVDHPDSALIIIGEGEDRPHLEAQIRASGLEHCVRLVGFVPDSALYLRAFDLFVLPSRSEALAYVLLEAGLASLPVVASRVGGIPEVIVHKRTGLLVAPETPLLLAGSMSTLLSDPALAGEYGTALRERVQERFSKERMVNETLALY